jgi:Xaa-Pro aminopeptidase
MQWTAYETIVGSGDRSTLLHARATDKVVHDGELVLIDAGGEWCGYCADITRVVPAGGKFSAKQREIYQTVLIAQKAAIAKVRPSVTLQEIHAVATEALIEQLSRLGHAEDELRRNIGQLMPHSTSHWIGLDVHDPCPYVDDTGSLIRLQAGMSFTVEPGLYFRSKEIFPEFYGIGVRIEDDVVVTETGCEILTSAPKELEEVEFLRPQA